ncbi:YKL065W-A [Zygosaccharomyces parabailii]|nr:YKL065W-A [Zygosaccharomyces parabailii]CDH16744.1 uncharacterized protein ZBAI_08532 [Zygosaccharomyces bailii ISA1307]
MLPAPYINEQSEEEMHYLSPEYHRQPIPHTHNTASNMNPTLIRSFSRSAARMSAANRASGSGMLNWFGYLFAVSGALGAGTLLVAYGNNANNSHIRNIFKNERSLTRTPHH